MKSLLIYLLSCVIVSYADNSENEISSVFSDFSDYSLSKTTVIFSIPVLFILLAVTIFLFRRLNSENRKEKYRLRKLDVSFNCDDVTVEHAQSRDLLVQLERKEISYDMRNFEIDLNSLNILENELGGGQFGVVNVGTIEKDGKTEKVAVKRSNNPGDPHEQKMILSELTVMCVLGKHPCLLTLIGGITKSNPHRIISEYMEAGNLRDYLRNFRSSFNDLIVWIGDKQKTNAYRNEVTVDVTNINELSTFHLISFAYQISKGMVYLAGIPCVHRDLALRNVLLSKDGTIRIGDFGLSRRYLDKDYYRPAVKSEHQPWLWMSPEASDDYKFSEKSDVWSFGICLFELFTLGKSPNINGFAFWEKIEYLLEPKYCPSEIYDHMKHCWERDPKCRPRFEWCLKAFERHLKNCSPRILENVENQLKVVAQQQEDLANWMTPLEIEPVENNEPFENCSKSAEQLINVQEAQFLSEYRFDMGTLRILKVIHQGYFGTVSRGILKGFKSDQTYLVAVKSGNKDSRLYRENEQKMMRAVGQHSNILCFAGSLSVGDRELLVTDFAENGNLGAYLRSCWEVFKNLIVLSENQEEKLAGKQGTDVLCTLDLVSFAYQIASGMKFIASKLIAHRNLTLANVLVIANKTVQISGFGLAKNLDEKGMHKMTRAEEDDPLALWFLAPESLRKHVYSEKSDVYAFAVCLYELFTLGRSPDLGSRPEEAEKFFKKGKQREKPSFCPNRIFELMLSCWEINPKHRPTFSSCVNTLRAYLAEHDSEMVKNIDDNLENVAMHQQKLRKWMD